MIEKKDFKEVIEKLGFELLSGTSEQYVKVFPELDCEVKVDFGNEKIIYPEDKGFIVNDHTTCNFQNSENFVVFECS